MPSVGGGATEGRSFTRVRRTISVAMEQWTTQHRVFAYDTFIRNGESVITTQRIFRRHFNIGRNGTVPSRNTLLRWVEAFRTTGTISKKKPPGPARTARTPENIASVSAAIIRSPHRSARQHARELNMSRDSVRRILRLDLKFHPYKMQVAQQLNVADYEQRKDFAVRMQVFFNDNRNAILLMSDEAHFHLNGSVNKQNFRYWATENPCNIHEKPLHSPKVTVWCAVAKFGVIGPYFFEENGVTVTVTSQRYVHMLNTFLRPDLQRRGFNMNNVYFQQDGATAHTARTSMEVLRNMFPGKLISRFGNVPWPPRSPDLSYCDYFLWGYLKERVYAHKPRNLIDLKDAITEEVNLIDQDMLTRVSNDFLRRLQTCIEADGHHMTDVIFKN